MKSNKSNIKKMSLGELLKEAHQLHFDVCQICNVLTKQMESPNGLVLKTLRDMRTLTKQCQKIDLELRLKSMAKSKELHEINSEKWSKKDPKN